VYLDFEGNVDHPPSLLGVLVGEEVRQWIVEPGLFPLQRLKNSAGYTSAAAPLDEALASVRQLAGEGGVIAAYTQHDIEVIAAYCGDPELRDWFGEHYRNAKKTLDYCYSRGLAPGGRDRERPRTLQEWADSYGFGVAGLHKPGNTGKRLRDVRAMLQARQADPEALTRVAKSKWTNLLGHNISDVRGLRHCTVRAARAINGSS
jgi:hypothetical protein